MFHVEQTLAIQTQGTQSRGAETARAFHVEHASTPHLAPLRGPPMFHVEHGVLPAPSAAPEALCCSTWNTLAPRPSPRFAHRHCSTWNRPHRSLETVRLVPRGTRGRPTARCFPVIRGVVFHVEHRRRTFPGGPARGPVRPPGGPGVMSGRRARRGAESRTGSSGGLVDQCEARCMPPPAVPPGFPGASQGWATWVESSAFPIRRAASARRPPPSTSPRASPPPSARRSSSTWTPRAMPAAGSGSSATNSTAPSMTPCSRAAPCAELIHPTELRYLQVVPATPDLTGAEVELVTQDKPRVPPARGAPSARGPVRLHPHRLSAVARAAHAQLAHRRRLACSSPCSASTTRSRACRS